MQPQYTSRQPNFKDITGQRFARLVALQAIGPDRTRRTLWLCQCDCGKQCIVPGENMRKGHTKSCGCLHNEGGKNWYKHGMTETRVFSIWTNMITRCTNSSSPSYRLYGGKGITVCSEWLHSFETFYADMGEPPSKNHSLDRIDSNGNYEPKNCRWATSLQQGRNTSRVHRITYDGVTRTLSEWAEIYGLKRRTLQDRLFKHHWTLERSLTTPVTR